jgi:hypothetical protein
MSKNNISEKLGQPDFVENLKANDCRCAVVSGKGVREIRSEVGRVIGKGIAEKLFGDAGDKTEIVVFTHARYSETKGNLGSALVYVVGGGDPVLLNSNAAMCNINVALRFAASEEFAGGILVDAI